MSVVGRLISRRQARERCAGVALTVQAVGDQAHEGRRISFGDVEIPRVMLAQGTDVLDVGLEPLVLGGQGSVSALVRAVNHAAPLPTVTREVSAPGKPSVRAKSAMNRPAGRRGRPTVVISRDTGPGGDAVPWRKPVRQSVRRSGDDRRADATHELRALIETT